MNLNRMKAALRTLKQELAPDQFQIESFLYVMADDGIDQLAEQVNSQPDKFPKLDCGTTCCIAGGIALSPEFRAAGGTVFANHAYQKGNPLFFHIQFEESEGELAAMAKYLDLPQWLVEATMGNSLEIERYAYYALSPSYKQEVDAEIERLDLRARYESRHVRTGKDGPDFFEWILDDTAEWPWPVVALKNAIEAFETLIQAEESGTLRQVLFDLINQEKYIRSWVADFDRTIDLAHPENLSAHYED